MEFWIGVVVGGTIGVFAGVLVIGLSVIAKEVDERMESKLANKLWRNSDGK